MRRVLGILLIVLALIAVPMAGWYGYRLYSAPAGPGAGADDEAIRDFIASDEFNRLFDFQKRKHLQAYVDRLKEKNFQQLIQAMMKNVGNRERSRAFIDNVQQVPGRDKIFSQMVGPALEKFYEQDERLRQRQMMLMAGFQQSQIAARPELFGLPSAEQFKGEMVRVFTNQPVEVQNQIAQFMLDFRETRRDMGMVDPF